MNLPTNLYISYQLPVCLSHPQSETRTFFAGMPVFGKRARVFGPETGKPASTPSYYEVSYLSVGIFFMYGRFTGGCPAKEAGSLLSANGKLGTPPGGDGWNGFGFITGSR